MSGPRFRVFAKSALILSLLVLAGCATPAPYAPMTPGQATGYTDRQLSDNRWRVTFTGNSVTPRETVENSLLQRAAEVTLASGHMDTVLGTGSDMAPASATVMAPAIGAFAPPGVMALSVRMSKSSAAPNTNPMPRLWC